MNKILFFLSLMLLPLNVFAVESVTESTNSWKNYQNITEWESVKWNFTSAADGSLTVNTSTNAYHGYVTMAVINPDDTNVPPLHWYAKITDDDGQDVFGGATDGLHNSTALQKNPIFNYTDSNSAYVTALKPRRIDGYLHFDVEDCSTTCSGTVTVYIHNKYSPYD